MRAGKRRSKKTPNLDRLLAILPELDEEGIAFLLEQAQVLRRNMEVEKINALSDKVAAAGPRPLPAALGSAGSGLRIERSEDGATYYLVVGGDWKMFTAEEMAAMVKITRSGEGEKEIESLLRSWLARERKDVFLDLGLDHPSNGEAAEFARLLVATFPPRSG